MNPDHFTCPDCADDLTTWADNADWHELDPAHRIPCAKCGR
jgi:hypothetical protein